MTYTSRLSVFSVLGAAVLTACGGGGGSTSATPTPPVAVTPPPPPPAASNDTPVAMASSAITTITGGGVFTVSAANSTDPNGDTLTTTWVQTAGPSILPGGTIQATNLTLASPEVTQDTALTFELTASDGTNSSTDTITVTAQALAAPETVRPVAPINTDAAAIIGLTNEGSDQYRVYWTDVSGTGDLASQTFTDDGAPVLNQIDASFELPQAGPTSSTQINALAPIAVIENGGTTYAPSLYVFENAVPALGAIIGPIEGNLSPLADPFITADVNAAAADFDQTPIGQNSLLNVTTQSTSNDAFVTVDIFTADGNNNSVGEAFMEIAAAGDPDAVASSVNNPAVSAIGQGGYIVSWRREDSNQSPTLRTIEAQIYTSDNALSGERITLTPSTGGGAGPRNQLAAASFDGANALIVWIDGQDQDANGDATSFTLQGRVVAPDGSFVSNTFPVSQSANNQRATAALPLSNGDVLVVWGEDDNTIRSRVISTTGSTLSAGTEFTLAANAESNVYRLLQTDTGRVIIGYNVPVSAMALTSEIVSFCPVGCE